MDNAYGRYMGAGEILLYMTVERRTRGRIACGRDEGRARNAGPYRTRYGLPETGRWTGHGRRLQAGRETTPSVTSGDSSPCQVAPMLSGSGRHNARPYPGEVLLMTVECGTGIEAPAGGTGGVRSAFTTVAWGTGCCRSVDKEKAMECPSSFLYSPEYIFPTI